MKQLDLKLAGQKVGSVSWRQEGNRIHAVARCPMEEGFIYRVQLTGSGQTLNLGVMAPQGADFALKRTLPAGRCAFLDGEAEARIVRTRPGEEPAEAPGGPLDRYRPVGPRFVTGDMGLDDAIGGKADVLYLLENNMLHVAFPLEIGKETAFAPFLAATRWLETERGGYGLLTLPQHTSLCAE